MRLVLHFGAGLSFLSGFIVLIAAKSPVQETSAFVLFVGSAVFIVGACIVEAISVARRRIELQLDILKLTVDPSPLESTPRGSSPQPSRFATLPIWKRKSNLQPTAHSPNSQAVEGTPESAQHDQYSPRHHGNSGNELDAWRALGDVRSLTDTGRRKQAKAALKELIARYPLTQAAAKAKRAFERVKRNSTASVMEAPVEDSIHDVSYLSSNAAPTVTR